MKVCLDPGHGGYDPGAVGNGLKEKDLTLAICLGLKPLLEYNGISAVLTRDGDYAPGNLEGNLKSELKARVDLAEINKVDLYVAIHVNAGGGTGEEILVIGIGGKAEIAAHKVLPYVVTAGGWANRGVKTQNVMVLRETSMPAILTENGFIDSITDATKLKDPIFRQALAVAHARGICDYFGIQYKESESPESKPNVLYRVILDGKQTMALSSQENAIAEVKKEVNSGQALKGIVQRTTDGVTVFGYSKPEIPPVDPGPEPLTKTPIMGQETITLVQCQQFLFKNNPTAPDIIPFYKEQGELLGIKWGYAVAQMVKETNYLKFGGDVRPEQNNFAGIGAVGGGEPGETFATQEEGALAHLEHLFAYASKNPLPIDMSQVDPRFYLVQRGSCPNWEDLNGHWAVPGIGYGEDIVSIYGRMTSEVVVDLDPAQEKRLALFIQKLIEFVKNFFKV